MSEGETNDLSARIAEEAASLPAEKQSAVLDFVLSIKESAAAASVAAEEDGDAAWERIIADPRPRPKLEAFMKAAAEEGDEPLDLDRM
ncbi:MAG: hypothetical protein ABIR71_09745 [Chthoniobacterales bacterium]